MSPLMLLPGALSELFACISLTGNITLADRYGLMAALLNDSLSEDELQSLDRLLHAVVRGRCRIVDQLSAVI